MGKIAIWVFLIIACSSCALMQAGYIDQNGQYVPKQPNFEFKDKLSKNISLNIDTVNIYRMISWNSHGVELFPVGRLSGFNSFIKFYPNGRCLSFSLPTKDILGNMRVLNEKDLNPNNPNYGKDYYIAKDQRIVEIERFTRGDGYGQYDILKYTSDDFSNTFILINKESKIVYSKEKIPASWKKFSVDW